VELSEVIRTIAKLGVIYGNRGGKFFWLCKSGSSVAETL
jgi:hypothetical protein